MPCAHTPCAATRAVAGAGPAGPHAGPGQGGRHGNPRATAAHATVLQKLAAATGRKRCAQAPRAVAHWVVAHGAAGAIAHLARGTSGCIRSQSAWLHAQRYREGCGNGNAAGKKRSLRTGAHGTVTADDGSFFKRRQHVQSTDSSTTRDERRRIFARMPETPRAALVTIDVVRHATGRRRRDKCQRGGHSPSV